MIGVELVALTFIMLTIFAFSSEIIMNGSLLGMFFSQAKINLGEIWLAKKCYPCAIHSQKFEKSHSFFYISLGFQFFWSKTGEKNNNGIVVNFQNFILFERSFSDLWTQSADEKSDSKILFSPLVTVTSKVYIYQFWLTNLSSLRHTNEPPIIIPVTCFTKIRTLGKFAQSRCCLYQMFHLKMIFFQQIKSENQRFIAIKKSQENNKFDIICRYT